MAHMNSATGQFEKNEDHKLNSKGEDIGQVNCAIGKQSNIKAQAKADSWHWNSFLKENADSSTGDLHEIGRQQLLRLTQLEVGVVARVRPDFIKRIGARLAEIQAVADTAPTPEQKKNIEDFIAEIKKRS
jgi:hypothetical protein